MSSLLGGDGSRGLVVDAEDLLLELASLDRLGMCLLARPVVLGASLPVAFWGDLKGTLLVAVKRNIFPIFIRKQKCRTKIFFFLTECIKGAI